MPKFFKISSLDTNRLIVHFQSDGTDTGVGFSMGYEMVDLPNEKPIIEVGDDLEADLHDVIEALAPQIADNHEQKLRERLTVWRYFLADYKNVLETFQTIRQSNGEV